MPQVCNIFDVFQQNSSTVLDALRPAEQRGIVPGADPDKGDPSCPTVGEANHGGKAFSWLPLHISFVQFNHFFLIFFS